MMDKKQLNDIINKQPLFDYKEHIPYEETYYAVAHWYKSGPTGSGPTVRYPTSREDLKGSLEVYFCNDGDIAEPMVVSGLWDLMDRAVKFQGRKTAKTTELRQ